MTKGIKALIGAMCLTTALTVFASFAGWGLSKPKVEKKFSIKHGSVRDRHHRHRHGYYLGK